jgi:hypothetical protein
MKNVEVMGRMVPLLKAARPLEMAAMACSRMPQWM